MNSTTYLMLGVMSGTSLDGVDLAYVRFTKTQNWEYELLACETVAYDEDWVARLRDAVAFSKDELVDLDREYTAYLAQLIQDFSARNPLKHIDAIASHGHTILHQPAKGLTYQIGNRSELAKLCENLVVCDFRVEDVALGGQGAPLVPIGDQLLFHKYDACLNIGGFANLSFQNGEERIAFDICPANIVLNQLTRELGEPFDRGGAIARKGTVSPELLAALNELPFYKEAAPKSLGLEWVKAEIFPILRTYEISVEDKIATFTAHISVQLAEAFKQLTSKKNGILVTGGGAYNTYLIESTQKLMQNTLFIPKAKLIEFKEALIFAFMGVLRLRNTNNVLKCVTGASKDHCAGLLYSP